MYVVIGQENHPDQFVTDTGYGPYDTFEEAHAAAMELNRGTDLYQYFALEIIRR